MIDSMRIYEKVVAMIIELMGIFFLALAFYEIGRGNPITPQASTTIGSILIALGSIIYAKLIPLRKILGED